MYFILKVEQSWTSCLTRPEAHEAEGLSEMCRHADFRVQAMSWKYEEMF